MNDLTKPDSTSMMSSREIAELYGKNHYDVLKKVRKLETAYVEVFGTDGNFSFSKYQDPTGRSLPEILLNKSQALFVAGRFDPLLHARAQKRWEELETARAAKPAIIPTTQTVNFELQLIGAKYTADMLRYSEASTLQIIHAVHENNGVSTLALPEYTEKVRPTFSAKDLLSKHSLNISSIKFNKLMIEKGLMEIKSRTGSKGQTKTFKSLVGDGLKYGQNDTHKSNSRETQAHYFEDTFLELFSIITGKK